MGAAASSAAPFTLSVPPLAWPMRPSIAGCPLAVHQTRQTHRAAAREQGPTRNLTPALRIAPEASHLKRPEQYDINASLQTVETLGQGPVHRRAEPGLGTFDMIRYQTRD
jgi:hypothetical protein